MDKSKETAKITKETQDRIIRHDHDRLKDPQKTQAESCDHWCPHVSPPCNCCDCLIERGKKEPPKKTIKIKQTNEFKNELTTPILTHKAYTPICECGGDLLVVGTDSDQKKARLTLKCKEKECLIITHIEANLWSWGNE